MNKSVFFSLIIPVYGVEEYIEKCLMSCINQDNFSPLLYEIIIIDDGSKDRSIEIARSIIKKNPNHKINIFTRENGGLSAARNTGLQKAIGKYVWFIDSDDFIASYSLSCIYRKLKENSHIEIFSFLHKAINYEEKIILEDYSKKAIKHKIQSGFDYLESRSFLSACTCVYSRSFLLSNNFSFLEGILWEDSEFNMRVLSCVSYNMHISEALYYYVRRNGSITTTGVSERMIKSWFIKIDSLVRYFSQRDLLHREKRIVADELTRTIFALASAISELPQEQYFIYRDKFLHKKNIWMVFIDQTGNYQFIVIGRLLFHFFYISAKLLNMRIKFSMIKNRYA